MGTMFLKSNERSEVEFRYNNSKDTKQAKRSRSDVSIKELYHIVLKLIRENLLKFN